VNDSPPPESDQPRARRLGERRTLLAVAGGAALGGVLRLLVTQLFEARGGAQYDLYATLLINVSGSFLLGGVIELARADAGLQPFWRLFLTTGLISGYTTFSALAYDALRLAAQGRALGALGYALISVALGVAAVYLGIAAARAAVPRGRSAPGGGAR
jgi:fluoride exporter